VCVVPPDAEQELVVTQMPAVPPTVHGSLMAARAVVNVRVRMKIEQCIFNCLACTVAFNI